ncbi:Putative oxidoreductase C terminal domain-containing protein [Maribacter sedimenticola]|uniref:Oxidoreductase C terminal domain-containing protein n=1 Tax=Maribacter sedimenticola TaxID=228956 RepID=A0ABY1SFG7_9FLAO|nr:putative oxidoreductase C-terminal domain-containing protein [Maribacter sedimenticola]SNR31463.1 Putative oxidoreductase C terminal domain-containing protein [Maribacter sedimenticola]
MKTTLKFKMIVAPALFLCLSCAREKKQVETTNGKEQLVKLMTLDPGHFHAALVQKTMYPQVDSTIHVFAPKGPEVDDFLNKIAQYNTRADDPTAWKVNTYLQDDYLHKMVTDKPGNVMVVAGKNSKKIDYILAAVKAGLNVYADKPLVINPDGFAKLKEAFRIAEEKGVLIYDIMTERFESTTMMQKKISMLPHIFGELVNGSAEEPAISKESVHHFYKFVSGKPLVRPAWFFDVNEEGEGIVDVTTHLVDLVQWEAFPDQIIDSSQIEMVHARRWPTVLSLQEFQDVTGMDTYPEYLEKDIAKDGLNVFSNGEMTYKINGKYAKVSVIWNYKAPEGTGDTHYSIMRGTKSNLIIKQGKEEGFKPVLYVESKLGDNFEKSLNLAIENEIGEQFPGTTLEKIEEGKWKIGIPDQFKIGHEAHFAQVTSNYLKYLELGELPKWEVPNMLTKYYTTIAAYKKAKEN